MNEYKIIINKLNEVLLLVNNDLTKNQVDDVHLYIDSGEWFLAWETLCDFLYEEKITISSKIYNLLEEIGFILQLGSPAWEALKERVNNTKIS